MQILKFPLLETIVLDVVAIFTTHFLTGYLCSKIPTNCLILNQRFFQPFSWERGGMIYQKIFKIRLWKKFIPGASEIYHDSFSLQHLTGNDLTYYELWIKESIRAEFCHWIMIIPGGFFFLWNDFISGLCIALGTLISNIIPIILQRFNRPRMRRLLIMTRLR